MAEYKQYITQVLENGNVMISEDVIAAIITETVSEIEGIEGLAMKPVAEFADRIGMNWGKGMKILINEDNSVDVDCNVLIKFGNSVIDLELREMPFIDEEAGKNFDGMIQGHNIYFYGLCKCCLEKKSHDTKETN